MNMNRDAVLGYVLLLAIGASVQAADPVPTAQRGALLPTEANLQVERGAAFPDDEVVWLSAGEAQVLAVFRAAVRPPLRGAFIILLPPGEAPDSSAAGVTLRHALPRRGFATLTVALPLDTGDAAAVRARLDAALAAVKSRAVDADVFVFGEALAAAWVVWAQAQGLGAAAVIALNLDLRTPIIDGVAPYGLLEQLSGPALILVESPRTWSPDVAVAVDTELQLLPPDYAGGERVERRLRGWLNRRFATRG
jgi:hypothetical protein